MSNDKYLSLTLVNLDTHRYFDNMITLGGPSTWIKLDEYPCKSPLRWSGKSLQSIFPGIVKTKEQLETKYQLLKLQTEAYNQNDIERDHALQKEINTQISNDVKEIYSFIWACFDSWKDVDNALITLIPPRWNGHGEDYYLTKDVKQKLKIDHLELIEDNDMIGLTKLLLPLYEAHHLGKSNILISTPFNNYLGDSIQVVYDEEHYYVTDDQDVFSEYDMYCNSDEDRVRVDQYLSNLAREYGCQYVGHEFRRTTNQRMHVKSTRGDFTEINNGLSELLQCVVCAYHDLKNALEKETN